MGQMLLCILPRFGRLVHPTKCLGCYEPTAQFVVLAPLGALVDLAAQKFLVPANKLEYLLSLAWGVAVGRPNQAPARFVARLKDLITLVGGGWKRDPGAHPGDGPRHRIAAPPGPFVLAAGSTPVGGRVGPALARPSGGDAFLAVESVPCQRPGHPPPPGPGAHR